MPQVWLTYEEYADFTGQPVEDVRALVRAEAWDIRKSRDGRTRLKLPLAHMAPYICRLAEHLNRTAAAGAAAGSQAERVEWLAQRLRSAGIEVRAAAGQAADDRAGNAPASPASLDHAA